MILDTNVVSALMHEPAHETVLEWLDRQPRISIWTTAITLLELRYGIEASAPSRRRARLFSSLERLVADKIEHRVAAFDAASANSAALLMAERRRSGRVGELRDTMIAGIVIANYATLATRNVRHFEDAPITIVDPWTA